MSNQYGKCHHTHYEGGPDCVHTAWQEGYLAAIDAAEAAVAELTDKGDSVRPADVMVAIRALKEKP